MAADSKYYIKFDVMSLEEDLFHEFKGHKNLCMEELPRWSCAHGLEKASRKAISRNLCGFLNTGLGGTVYCGVLDDGSISGLKLTQYQRDHVVATMTDLMSRYSPPVPPQRYKVRFVPVLSPNTPESDRDELAKVDTRAFVDDSERKREHILRSPHYCWCDRDCKMQFENGIIPTDYVIELIIKQWNCDDENNKGLAEHLNLHPIHADEDGKVYFRREGKLVQYNLQELTTLTHYEAHTRHNAIIERLTQQIELYRCKINSKLNSQA